MTEKYFSQELQKGLKKTTGISRISGERERFQKLEEWGGVTSELVCCEVIAMNRVMSHMLSCSQWNSGHYQLVLKTMMNTRQTCKVLAHQGPVSRKSL